jgi:hypothetical protein
MSNSKVKGQKVKVMVLNKGLTIRNTHVKYENPSTYQSKVIAKVKDLLMDRRTDRWTDRQSHHYKAPAISRALKM